VDLKIQSPTAIHQGWNAINGTIWAVGAFGLDWYDRDAPKTIAILQRVQSKECRPDGIIAEDRLYKGYLESIEAIKRPKLLTLTLRNVPILTRKYIRGLRKSFTKLMHRKWYKERVRGGLQTIEIVNKGNGWHVHMHVMLDADYLPQKKIAKDWLEITGDSFMVDIREAGTVKEGLKYCLKYLSKAPVLSGHEEEYRDTVKGLRLVQPFGSIYGELVMHLPSVPCPECGSVRWIVWGFELEPEFRRFLDNKGLG
jgi:hypothetical protein